MTNWLRFLADGLIANYLVSPLMIFLLLKLDTRLFDEKVVRSIKLVDFYTTHIMTWFLLSGISIYVLSALIDRFKNKPILIEEALVSIFALEVWLACRYSDWINQHVFPLSTLFVLSLICLFYFDNKVKNKSNKHKN